VLAACGDDAQPVPPTGSTTSAVTADENQLADKARQRVQALLAALQSEESVRDFLDGNDPAKGEQSDCYDTSKTSPPDATLTVTFKNGSGCLATSGSIMFARQGQAGSKHVLATVGSETQPVKVGGFFVSGHARFDRAGVLEYLAAGADKDGVAFKDSEACDQANARCLRVCIAAKDATSCPPKNARLGLSGTLKGELKASEKAIHVTFKGSGSAWAQTQSPETRSETAFTQAIKIGSSAVDSCPGGLSVPADILYVVPLTKPANMKLDCACPKAGTISSEGNIWVNVKVDCGNVPSAIQGTINIAGAKTEVEFRQPCGTIETATCSGTSSFGYSQSNFKACAPSMSCGQVVRNLLGCNADCTSCTKQVSMPDLEQYVPSIADLIKEQLGKVGKEFKDAASAACSVAE
jgi:hypothetical protein